MVKQFKSAHASKRVMAALAVGALAAGFIFRQRREKESALCSRHLFSLRVFLGAARRKSKEIALNIRSG